MNDKKIKEILSQYRDWLIVGEDKFKEMSKYETEGKYFDRGVASGYLSARGKLEELFDY